MFKLLKKAFSSIKIYSMLTLITDYIFTYAQISVFWHKKPSDLRCCEAIA